MTPNEILQAENARLKETIEDLRFELADARRDNDDRKVNDFVRRVLAGLYRLTGGEAEIIFALWKANGRYTGTNDMIDRADHEVLNLASHIKRIRKRVGKTRILTVYGSGYALSSEWRSELDGLWKVHIADDQSFSSVAPRPVKPRLDRRVA